MKETCPTSTRTVLEIQVFWDIRIMDDFFFRGSTALVGQGLLIGEISILHSARHAPQSVGLPWASDWSIAETATWQHSALIICYRRCSNPQSQETSGRRPLHYTARPPEEYAVIVLHEHSARGRVKCGCTYVKNKISVNTFRRFAECHMYLTRICLFDGHTKEVPNKLFYNLSEYNH